MTSLLSIFDEASVDIAVAANVILSRLKSSIACFSCSLAWIKNVTPVKMLTIITLTVWKMENKQQYNKVAQMECKTVQILAPRLLKNFMLNSAENEIFPAHKC